jgi:lysophospholipase L1-like esterase
MPDQLHLNPAAYRLWADAMQPVLEEMLDTKQ